MSHDDSTVPRDGITRLQHAVTDVCDVYKNALGLLLVESDRLLVGNGADAATVASSSVAVAHDRATQVVLAHRELERLATELDQVHRPEEEQMSKLEELQARHAAVTEELRLETEAAEAVHARVHSSLESLLDGILEVNAGHRAANAL